MDLLSALDYIQVRFYILFLHSIVPISIMYCLLLVTFPVLLHTIRTHRFFIAIECWLVAEAISYFLFYLPLKHYLHRSATHPENLPREEREKLVERCWSTITDPERYLSQWFRGASKEEIKRENVRQFIHWAFFNAEEVESSDEEEVEIYLEQVEKLLGRKLPPGIGKAKSIRLTLDTVGCSYRSLFWYFCIAVVDTITYVSMLANGYHLHRSSASQFFTLFPFRPLALLSSKKSPVKSLTYWHKEHLSRTRLPVLFIHGIGVGLYPYTNFLRDINAAGGHDTDVGVIAIEIMTVSSRITHQAFDKDVLNDEIRRILRHHGWSNYVLVGHSYGTVICTQLLKSESTKPFIGPVVFIDPICFLLHLPDVAYNFTVRQPVHVKEFVLWYFGSKDIGVAHTLARRFFWHESILWKEDLAMLEKQEVEQRTVTVVLSGKDDIIDAKAVRKYLSSASMTAPSIHDAVLANTNEERVTRAYGDVGLMEVISSAGTKLEIIWFERFHHGQAFNFKRARNTIISAIRAY